MSKTKYCAFDYDDTLMQTRECKTQALIEFGKRKFDLDINSAFIQENWGIPHSALFETLFNVSGPELQETMDDYFKTDAEFPLSPHEDLRATLEHLQERYTLIIVSSCERRLIENQLAGPELRHLRFAAIFGYEQTTHHKPSGRVFDEMFNAFDDMTPQNVTYIGDSHKDFAAARERGIAFLGVDRAAKETKAMTDAGARVMQTLQNIPSFLA